MGKKRIYELAKEINVASKDLLEVAGKKGYDLKNHMATIDDAQEKVLRASLHKEAKPATVESKPAATTSAPKSSEKTDNGKIKINKAAIRRRPEASSKPAPHANNQRPQGNRNGQAANGQSRNNTNGRPNNNNARPNNSRPNNGRPNNNAANRPNSNARPSGSNQPLSLQEQISQANARRQKTQERIQQQREQREADEKKRRQQSNRPRPTGNNSRPTGNKPAGARPTTTNNRPANSSNNGRPVNNTNSRPNNNSNPSRPVSAQEMQQKMQANTVSAAKPASNNTAASKPKNFGPDKKRGGGYNSYGNNRQRFNKKRKKTRKQQLAEQNAAKKEMPQRKERPLPEVLVFSEGMNVADIAKKIHREPAEIIKKLFMLGIMVNMNQSLDKDTIELLATDYGIEAEQKVEVDIADIDSVFETEAKSDANLVSRPPVVTIMGHVDHGKTTLLDNLRHSHVTDGEAGGITQHIGAYQTKLNDRLITFLDTPGHAAFSNMRARGADITDIIILVVAADDGVMPQTIEAINHAKAAKAPIIVAVNKIDKPGANPDHVMEQLMGYGLVPEDWGGDTIFVKISAKTGENIDELLEMVLLEADVLELKANPDQKAVGTVIEARLDKGKGPVASLLVQQGTLKIGDPIVVGNTFGRVRVMTNDRGRRVKEVFPSEPVEITGLNDVPQAADRFVVFEDEKTARAAGEERAKRALLKERSRANPVTLDNLFETMKQGELKEVDVIIKADVQGSSEALAGSLRKIEVEGVRVNIIHEAVGAINESDVTLAAASNAIIIGFNVRPTPQAKIQADAEQVDIRLHRIIYKAIEEIEAAMKGMLEPVYEEKVIGQLTVREIYNVSKIGTIAGCIVDTGVIQRDSGVRLIRDSIVIYEGKLSSLKRFKDDVKEVKTGFECGVTIEDYNDIKIDDQIEAYVMEEVPVK
ncbi:translation initiation factor IF-2 [Latilactobacillus graminis]|uniref:Translation initiation factor IF-2 n=2 Tax=Latilactobacillus graminis TaxID=60519 RepID=A0AA89KXE2_9LACO|nr:translation initiation factor IF-2 [Latilactobacillus graminis]KRM22445.1 infB protein [Latilactobacillus graminis DSM 20719]QFP79386.1 translation initiation factor IF-2 [Latilactobacillus graminis]